MIKKIEEIILAGVKIWSDDGGLTNYLDEKSVTDTAKSLASLLELDEKKIIKVLGKALCDWIDDVDVDNLGRGIKADSYQAKAICSSHRKGELFKDV